MRIWPAVHPIMQQRGPDPGLQTEIPFNMFHIYCTSDCMQSSVKLLETDLVIAKFKYLTLSTI